MPSVFDAALEYMSNNYISVINDYVGNYYNSLKHNLVHLDVFRVIPYELSLELSKKEISLLDKHFTRYKFKWIKEFKKQNPDVVCLTNSEINNLICEILGYTIISDTECLTKKGVKLSIPNFVNSQDEMEKCLYNLYFFDDKFDVKLYLNYSNKIMDGNKQPYPWRLVVGALPSEKCEAVLKLYKKWS